MDIYLDHSATTPLRPEVWDAMERVERGTEFFANPSSPHRPGLRAAKALSQAREMVASVLGADPSEIVFTGGGSEAINLAIKGVTWASDSPRPRLVTTAIEHHAALHACQWLATRGMDLTVLPVDLGGLVAPEAVAESLCDNTALVSVMYVNNEVGSIQPIREIARICQERGVPLHVDAVQAAGRLCLDVSELGCDLLSLSAHKVYGPKGVGCLYVRKGLRLEPLVHGGGQEHRLRAGTQNVAGIVGLAEALRLAEAERDENWERAKSLRTILGRLPAELNAVRINGNPAHVLPHILSVTILFCDGMTLMSNLSTRGVYVSTGSACTSGALVPSHVLKAMGLSDQAAYCTLRFSTGRSTTAAEVHAAVDITKELASLIREVTMPEDIGQCTEDCPCFLTA